MRTIESRHCTANSRQLSSVAGSDASTVSTSPVKRERTRPVGCDSNQLRRARMTAAKTWLCSRCEERSVIIANRRPWQPLRSTTPSTRPPYTPA